MIQDLLGILKPHISPSEFDRYSKIYWGLKEENEKRRKKIKDALLADDVPTLNALLAELLDLPD